MSVRRQLLLQLTDGQCHSGEVLAQALGISRAAVWKQIQTMQADGIQIESLPGQGYRLTTPIELLDHDMIKAGLPDALQQQIHLEIFESLPSTNTYLTQSQPNEKKVHICLAEKQTDGRGRRGRAWQTPYGTTIALSLRWQFAADTGRLAGLSLAVGVTIAECLQEFGIEGVKLKWPNDLMINQAKLGGILIDVSGDASGPCQLVIGVGLNMINSMASPEAGMSLVDQAWVDLASVVQGLPPSRNNLVAKLIQALVELLPRFEAQGFAAYQNAFMQRDVLYQRTVDVQQANQSYEGIAQGVDKQGALLIRKGRDILSVSAGEVSVKAHSESMHASVN